MGSSETGKSKDTKHSKHTKKSKNSKKSKGKSEINDDLPELPVLYYGESDFEFPNGDRYSGQFGAHRLGIVWREGHGIYTTKDGQIYEGEWKDDKLIEDSIVTIKYANGCQYSGKLSKNKYSGPATYILENGLVVSGHFDENLLVQDITLIDVDANLWSSTGKSNSNGALLLPENIFYLNLDDNRGKGVLKPKYSESREKSISVVVEEEQALISEAEEEKRIFGKSLKTRSSLNFEDSLWYQRFANFEKKKARVYDIIAKDGIGALDEQDRKWHEKFEKVKSNRKKQEKQNQQKAVSREQEVDVSLLEQLHSKKYRESCPALKVFYPSCKYENEKKVKKESDATEPEEGSASVTEEKSKEVEGNKGNQKEEEEPGLNLDRIRDKLRKNVLDVEQQWYEKYKQLKAETETKIRTSGLSKGNNANSSFLDNLCETGDIKMFNFPDQDQSVDSEKCECPLEKCWCNRSCN